MFDGGACGGSNVSLHRFILGSRERRGNIACNVRYRPVNSDEWKEAMPLWFDPRGPEEHSQVLSRRTRGNREPEPQHDYSRQYRGVPIYGPNNGDNEFTLAPDSPGYDAGVLIPNFNDDFTGKAPDMGAHEAGTPPMRFGIGN